MKLLATCVALVSLLTACSTKTEETPSIESVKSAFKSRFPDRPVMSVSTTPVKKGLYEIVLEGNKVVYVDSQADYLMLGNLVDVKNNISLTSQKEKELSRVDWKTLPLDSAIKEVRGTGARKLAIFTDPDCSFCKRLERESLKGVTNVTIYTFLYPLTQIHPDALHKSKQIWCAPDRLAAWIAYMREDKPLTGPDNCITPLDDVRKLGERLAITGTPTLVFANGLLEAGALPRENLEKLLNQ